MDNTRLKTAELLIAQGAPLEREELGLQLPAKLPGTRGTGLGHHPQSSLGSISRWTTSAGLSLSLSPSAHQSLGLPWQGGIETQEEAGGAEDGKGGVYFKGKDELCTCFNNINST